MVTVPQDVLLFCQIFGAFPLKLTNGSKGNKRISFSLTVFLWGLTVIILQTVLSFAALYVDYTGYIKSRPIRMGSNTSTVAVALDVVVLNLMAIVVFVTSVKKYPSFIEMCRILERVDQILCHTMHKRPTKITKKVVLVFIHLIILLPVTVILEFSFVKENDEDSFGVYVPFYTLYCSQAALFVHFTHVTRHIAKRFRMVNERMKQELLRKNYGQLMIEKCLPSIDATRGGAPPVSQVRILTDVYWLLCESVRQANNFYSSQLLAAIFSAFVHIIITLYYFFLHTWPRIESDQVPFLMMQALWIVTHISHLVLLVWPCTTVTNAADETAPIICKLINKQLQPEIRSQLEAFLLQLLHHNARFSALGFFQIHNHILTSIAGSVTTYLVILIQFQTSASEEDQSSVFQSCQSLLP